MTQQNTTGTSRNGTLDNMLNEMMSAGRLVFDGRVPLTLKLLLPVAALVYWIWPIDLMPGLPFDDVAVLLVALHFFVQMANQSINRQEETTAKTAAPGDSTTVDTTWRVIE